jgi:hypothetical protein
VEEFRDVANTDLVDIRKLLSVDANPGVERRLVSEGKELGISISVGLELRS